MHAERRPAIERERGQRAGEQEGRAGQAVFGAERQRLRQQQRADDRGDAGEAGDAALQRALVRRHRPCATAARCIAGKTRPVARAEREQRVDLPVGVTKA